MILAFHITLILTQLGKEII